MTRQLAAVLVVALASSAGAEAPPAAAPTPASPAIGHPDDPIGACNAYEMQLMLTRPRDVLANRTEVERRSAIVLAEERRVMEEGKPKPNDWLIHVGVPSLLAFGGLLTVVIAASRRRRLIALVGGLLCLGAGTLVLRAVDVRRQIEVRVSQLRECRIQLAETKHGLMLSELAHAYDRIEEAEEDLLGWETRLREQGAITLEELGKLRRELTGR